MWTDLSRDQFIMMVWVVSAFSFFGGGLWWRHGAKSSPQKLFVLSREILFLLESQFCLSLSHHRQLSKSQKKSWDPEFRIY